MARIVSCIKDKYSLQNDSMTEKLTNDTSSLGISSKIFIPRNGGAVQNLESVCPLLNKIKSTDFVSGGDDVGRLTLESPLATSETGHNRKKRKDIQTSSDPNHGN